MNGQVEGRIASRQSAEEALSASCDLFIDLFTASDDEVTRQRAADVRDLRGAMLRLLLGLPETDFSALKPGTVLLAEELSPSAVSVLNSANVAGIVLGKGGPPPTAPFSPGPWRSPRCWAWKTACWTPPPERRSLWTGTGAARCFPPAR